MDITDVKRLRGTPPGVVGACSGPSGAPPVAPVAPWLSSCGASQYRTRGLIPGPRGSYCSNPSRRWYLLEKVEARQCGRFRGTSLGAHLGCLFASGPALALVLHLPVKCGSRTPGLEFHCRIVSREGGYCVSWVPLGVERVACMTAAYLKTLALICLTKLFW